MITRALLFLLVVLNVGVALWWMTRADAAPPPRDDAEAAGVVRLRLASEDVAPAIATAEPSVSDAPGNAGDGDPATTAAVPAGCLALGPFADAAAAEAAQRAMPATIIRTQLREAAVASNRGWRVMMPAQPSRAAAIALAERIRQAGFDDLYVVTEGDEANSIALGLFSSERAARGHVAALRAAGFEAGSGRVAGAAAHWLDVALADGADAAAIRRAAGARDAQDIDCARLR